MGIFGSKMDFKYDPQQELRHTRDDCVFCRIAEEARTGQNAKVIYQNERLVVIHDIRPAARHHLLVIPLEHIANTNVLTAADLNLIDEMRQVGQAVLLTQMVQGGHYAPISPARKHQQNRSKDSHSGMDVEAAFASAGSSGQAPPADMCVHVPEPRRSQLLARTKFGYHVPPYRSVDHLHLHCFGLPHQPAWRTFKYSLPSVWLPAEQLRQRLARTQAAHAPAGVR